VNTVVASCSLVQQEKVSHGVVDQARMASRNYADELQGNVADKADLGWPSTNFSSLMHLPW
jgi:hypothetical protein